MIPVSTAKFDPKWYTNRGKIYKDKNGVYNGIKALPFVPGPLCDSLCQGRENCAATANPFSCAFLRNYHVQLNQLNFKEIMAEFEKLGNQIRQIEQFPQEPILVLLVYETPENPCSERRIIQQWFKDNGYILEEFNKENF